jgi:hypothetical protein
MGHGTVNSFVIFDITNTTTTLAPGPIRQNKWEFSTCFFHADKNFLSNLLKKLLSA